MRSSNSKFNYINFQFSFLAITLILGSGCTREVNNYIPGETTNTQAVIEHYAINVRNGSTEECPAGGKVYEVYIDNDTSNSFTEGERIISSQSVCNGSNGANGQNGQNGNHAPVSPLTPVELIFPCGNTAAYKEVLLRLQNGQVLASFSDNAAGSMTRLTILPDGDYMNTDNTGCNFNLSTSSDGHIRSISWMGQVQMFWNMML